MNGSPERAQVVAQPAEELGHDKTLDVSAERVNSEAQTQHDPLCPFPDCDYGEPEGGCYGYEDCWHRCVCDVIARVRADERERAAQRVGRIPIWGDQYDITVCRWSSAIAAARGEQP